jgi:hypothetical protein
MTAPNAAADTPVGTAPPKAPPVPTTPAAAPPSTATSTAHDLYGMLVVVTGVLAIVVLAIVLVVKAPTGTEVTAILGTLAGAVVAMVSAYFGINAVVHGQAQSTNAQADTTKKAVAAALMATPPSDPDDRASIRAMLQ